MSEFTEDWFKQHMSKFSKPLDAVGVTGNVGKFDARDVLQPPMEPKPSKYRNRKTTVDGIVFDSAKEARRWQELNLLLAAGEIGMLDRQVPWILDVNGEHICDYVSDFCYQLRGGGWVIEDVKSEHTRKLPVYRLKKKLMKAIHGIEVREV